METQSVNGQQRSLDKLFATANTMAEVFLEHRERQNVAEGRKPWNIFNSPYENYARRVVGLENIEPLDELIEAARAKSPDGQLIILHIGATDNPFKHLLKPDDVVIALALGDHRGELERRKGEHENFYVIEGTIGGPMLWQYVDQKLEDLLQRGLIKRKTFNIQIGKLVAGWNSLPLNQEVIDNFWMNYEGIVEEIQPLITSFDEEIFHMYRSWFMQQLWSRLERNGFVLLDNATLMPSLASLIKKWIDSLRFILPRAVHDNTDFFLEKDENSPQVLPES